MANGVKEIKTRIRAARSIRKITKAMELVSVSKMRKAVQMALSLRIYAKEAWRVLGDLAEQTEITAHPFFANSFSPKSVLMILFTSDRGLCGSLNSSLWNAVLGKCKDITRATARNKQVNNASDNVVINFVTVGKKGQDLVSRSGYKIAAAFSAVHTTDTLTHITPIVRIINNGFISGQYDHVFIVYPNFISVVVQKPVIHQLLPIAYDRESGQVGEVEEARALSHKEFDFKFEPRRKQVLEALVPRLIEAQLYQVSLETTASEHAARMFAMKNATESASQMVDDLTLTFNAARQAAITREIAEISAGKAVLE